MIVDETSTGRSTASVIDPLVATTFSVNVPVDALELAVMIRGDVEFPATGLESMKSTPVGAAPTQDAERSTSESNPFTEFTVIEAVVLEPGVKEKMLGQQAVM